MTVGLDIKTFDVKNNIKLCTHKDYILGIISIDL